MLLDVFVVGLLQLELITLLVYPLKEKFTKVCPGQRLLDRRVPIRVPPNVHVVQQWLPLHNCLLTEILIGIYQLLKLTVATILCKL